MAAAPKLTPEQWADARQRWEGDSRSGFAWLVKEMGLSVSKQGVADRAKREGWEKEVPSAGQVAPKRAEKALAGKLAKAAGDKLASPPTSLPDEDAPEEAIDGLTPRQAMFVREYLVDLNGTQAAIRAGYSENGADAAAARLLGNVRVKAAIAEQQASRIERLELDADGLVKHWAMVATADPNELSQHWRHCCRYCWGAEHRYQYTPAEYEQAKQKHEARRDAILADGRDIGEFPVAPGDWWNMLRDAHPKCPECFGLGVEAVFLADTRKLSPAARALYVGTKKTKNGIEILTRSQEKAGEMLGRALGVFKDKDADAAANTVDRAELRDRFERLMSDARERQARVLQERGLPAEDE